MGFFVLFLFGLNGTDMVVPYHIRVPVFCASSDTDWLLGDYYNGGLIRVNTRGEITQKISYGTGQGPGEFRTSRFILEFPEEKIILVIGKNADTHTFHSHSGKFIGKIISFLPYVGAVKWDEKHFLMLWGRNVLDAKAKDAFILFDLEGKQIESWQVRQPQWQKKFLYQTSRGVAMDARKTVYFGNMARPELFVYKQKYSEQEIWKLKPPKGYRLPPAKDLARKDMMNQAKRYAYFGSFTYINNIFSIGEKFLVVAWINAGGRKQSFDLYRFDDRSLISSNTEVEGTIVGVTEKHVITRLPGDDSLPEEVDQTIFQKYPITY